MMQGKLKAALRLIDDESKGGLLQLYDRIDPSKDITVCDVATNAPSLPMCMRHEVQH